MNHLANSATLTAALLACSVMNSAVEAGSRGYEAGSRAVTIEIEGLSLSARLYSADGMQPGPALLLLHGWTWPDDDPSRAMTDVALEFRRNGYTVLVPSMRGWPPTGGVDDCAGEQVADAVRMLEWLGRQPGVDANSRFLAGYSQGGQVALLAAASGAPVKAVAAFAPVVDPGSWGDETVVSGIRDYVMEECGGPDGWPSRNVMERVDALRRPLLLVHGEADRRVPTEQSTRLYENLKTMQRPAQLKLIPGAGHDQGVVLRPQLAIDFFRASASSESPP